MKRSLRLGLAFAAALAAPWASAADPVETLRSFVRDVKSGRADFTQTVTSPDGAKKKSSSGSFDFARPNRFRFAYAKPFEQTIVGDGEKVWIYDADLNQVSSRKLGQALGATPAALLAGGSLERDFDLANLPREGRPRVGRGQAQGQGRRVPGGARRLQGQRARGARDHRQLRPEVAASLQWLRRQRAGQRRSVPLQGAARAPT